MFVNIRAKKQESIYPSVTGFEFHSLSNPDASKLYLYLTHILCFLLGTLTSEVQSSSSEGEVLGFEVELSSSEAQRWCSEGETSSYEGEVSSFLLGC